MYVHISLPGVRHISTPRIQRTWSKLNPRIFFVWGTSAPDKSEEKDERPDGYTEYGVISILLEVSSQTGSREQRSKQRIYPGTHIYNRKNWSLVESINVSSRLLHPDFMQLRMGPRSRYVRIKVGNCKTIGSTNSPLPQSRKRQHEGPELGVRACLSTVNSLEN